MKDWHELEKEFTKELEKNFEIYGEHMDKSPYARVKFLELDTMVDTFIRFYGYFQEYHEFRRSEVKSMLENVIVEKYNLYLLLGGVRVKKTVSIPLDSNRVMREYEKIFYELYLKAKENVANASTKDEKKAKLKEMMQVRLAYSKGFTGRSKGIAENYSKEFDMNVSKLFAKLFGANSIITTSYSNLIQNQEIEEDLYISISPLDFMTMSENSYDWQSCLRLKGEFSGGSLSYMKDSSSAVAFIGKYNSSFPALDKKWRQLVYLQTARSSIGFAQSRQYPDNIDAVQEEVSRMMFAQINTYAEVNLNYTSLEYTYDEFENFRDGLHYYDLSNSHKSYRAHFEDSNPLMGLDLGLIGSASYCLHCGDEMYDAEYVYGYVCSDCN